MVAFACKGSKEARGKVLMKDCPLIGVSVKVGVVAHDVQVRVADRCRHLGTEIFYFPMCCSCYWLCCFLRAWWEWGKASDSCL